MIVAWHRDSRSINSNGGHEDRRARTLYVGNASHFKGGCETKVLGDNRRSLNGRNEHERARRSPGTCCRTSLAGCGHDPAREGGYIRPSRVVSWIAGRCAPCGSILESAPRGNAYSVASRRQRIRRHFIAAGFERATATTYSAARRRHRIYEGGPHFVRAIRLAALT